MSDAKPPLVAELVWVQDLQFAAGSGTNAIVVDGNSHAGPSPVHLLVVALAACMAADVVDILRKGRHALSACRTSVTAQRQPEPPRHLTAVRLEFHVHGDVAAAAVERAIQLSRDRYCSVWHSLRQDIDLTTDCRIVRAEA